MQRFLTYTFLILSFGLTWWGLELQLQLARKEKELLEIRQQRDAARAAEKLARAEVAPLSENIARLTRERDEARSRAGTSAATAEALPGNQSPDEKKADNLISGLISGMNTPEMHKLLHSQSVSATRKEYMPLVKKWGLGQAESSQLFDLLAKRDSGMNIVSALGENGLDDAKLPELIAAEKTRAGELSKEIEALIGPEKKKLLDAFEKEQTELQTVARYAEHLDTHGFPLTEPQRRDLAAIISKEQPQANIPESGNFDEPSIAAAIKRNEESQRRIVNAATGLLDPDQINALQSAFREENTEQEAGMKMAGQLFKDGIPGAKIGPGKVKVRILNGTQPGTQPPPK